ncbi:MAG: DUF4173 domain-containing protein [Anaerolineales bacterium]|nr:DUF4173 domain-containing protein [Anaerolineales bacterium]
MKRTVLFWLTALILGWCFDLLFWKQMAGINFPTYVLLTVAGGFLVLKLEGLKPAWKSLLLLAPILFLAGMVAVRHEPLSVFLAVVFTLSSMGVLTITALGGHWLRYSLSDYVVGFLGLAASLFVRPLIFLTEKKPLEEAAATRRSGGKRVWAVVRGLLIALPVVVVFAALLASADAVFAARLEDFVELFCLERLPEYILRGILILVVAYAIAGAILHAMWKSQDEKLIGVDRPLVRPFLGSIEASVVLGAVVALFAIFVAIQFQYFFGGQTNIHIDGYTYAEYARRGFGELVTVAFFSLLLFLGLSGAVKRESKSQHGWFSGLGIAMVVLVGVMLVSAFQRLMLYENAYGFSRLRTYTHVFMIWLGALLLTVVVLDLLRRQRSVALAGLVAAVGFAVSLLVLNVDGFIVRQNVARSGVALDVAYLASLSPDAIPDLVAAYRDPDLPVETRDAVGAALICMPFDDSRRAAAGWQSFHLSAWRAGQALESVDLSAYELVDRDWPIRVITPGGEEYDCWTSDPRD